MTRAAAAGLRSMAAPIRAAAGARTFRTTAAASLKLQPEANLEVLQPPPSLWPMHPRAQDTSESIRT